MDEQKEAMITKYQVQLLIYILCIAIFAFTVYASIIWENDKYYFIIPSVILIKRLWSYANGLTKKKEEAVKQE